MAVAGLAFTFPADLSQNPAPLTPSVPAFHFTNTGELCSCPAVLQGE